MNVEKKWMRADCPRCGRTFEFTMIATCPCSPLWQGREPTTRFLLTQSKQEAK